MIYDKEINIIYSDSSNSKQENYYNVYYDITQDGIKNDLDVDLIVASDILKVHEYRLNYNIPVFYIYPTYRLDSDAITPSNEAIFLNEEDFFDYTSFQKIFDYDYIKTNYTEKIYNNFNFVTFLENSDEVFPPLKIEHYKFTLNYLFERISSYRETGIFSGYDNEIESWTNSQSKDNFIRKFDTLIIAQHYPSIENHYGNGFVHRRIVSYVKNGKKCIVLLINKKVPNTSYMIDNIIVTGELNISLKDIIKKYDIQRIITHNFPVKDYSKEFINFLKDNSSNSLTLFSHGSDIMSAWRRFSDVAPDKKLWYLGITRKRQAQWKNFMKIVKKAKISSDQLNTIFVSEYLQKVTYRDISKRLFKPYSHVIHNYIDDTIFTYQPKDASQRFEILAIRSFKSNTYANDILAKVIIELSHHKEFNKMNFLIVGDGPLHSGIEKQLRKFKNVTFDKNFKAQLDIAKIHKNYGIYLSPARMDTQGVSRDEAMSSGLVAIANDVGGTKEFINNDVGYLVPKEDYKKMAQCVIELIENPEIFLKKSKLSAQHTREISGFDSTIKKEIRCIYGQE